MKKEECRLGTIVHSIDGDEFMVGYIYRLDLESNKVKVMWLCNFSEWEFITTLQVVQSDDYFKLLCTYIKKHRTDYELIENWFRAVNGQENENDVLLLGDNRELYLASHIKFEEGALKDIYEPKRKINVYKELGDYIVYRSYISTINGKMSSWGNNSFYIVKKGIDKVYFGGINNDIRGVLAILYNLD